MTPFDRPELASAFGVAEEEPLQDTPPAVSAERTDLASAFGLSETPAAVAPTSGDRSDLASAFGVPEFESEVSAIHQGEGLRSELSKRMQDAKIFPSFTQTLDHAGNENLTRRADGNWDLPAMNITTTSEGFGQGVVAGIANLAKRGTGAISNAFGGRLESVGDEESQSQVRNVFDTYQRDKGLSDTQMQSVWKDLNNRYRKWGEKEDLRVQSDGSLELNPLSSTLLDTDKATQAIQASGATQAAKDFAIQQIPQMQEQAARNKAQSYGAASIAAGRGDFSTYLNAYTALHKDQGVIPLADVVKNYEKDVVEKEPVLQKYLVGIQDKLIQGGGDMISTGQGIAGMLGSTAAANASAKTSADAALLGQGSPDIGIAGDILQQAPNIAAQILLTRGAGAAAGAALGEGALANLATQGAAYSLAGAQSAGSTFASEYQENLAKGMSEQQAMTDARKKGVQAGVNTAIVTSMFGSGALGGVEKAAVGKEVSEMTLRDMPTMAGQKGLTSVLKSPEFRTLLKDVGKSYLGEGSEEFVDQLGQEFLNQDPDANLSDALDNSIKAFKIGGAAGGAADIATSAMTKGTIRTNAEALDLASQAAPAAPSAAQAVREEVIAENAQAAQPEAAAAVSSVMGTPAAAVEGATDIPPNVTAAAPATAEAAAQESGVEAPIQGDINSQESIPNAPETPLVDGSAPVSPTEEDFPVTQMGEPVEATPGEALPTSPQGIVPTDSLPEDTATAVTSTAAVAPQLTANTPNAIPEPMESVSTGAGIDAQTVKAAAPQLTDEQADVSAKLVNLWTSGVNAGVTVEGKGGRDVKGETLRQYAGVKAQLGVEAQESLKTAKTMSDEGKTPEQIRALTGWFPGPDGKLRFEIPDNQAKQKTVSEEKARYSLDEVLDHPAFFEAYPDARKIQVVERPDLYGEHNGGMELDEIRPERGRLMVHSLRDGVDRTSLLLHEIQHYIQAKEGFSRGTSPSEQATLRRARAAYEKSPKFKEDVADAKSKLTTTEAALKDAINERKPVWAQGELEAKKSRVSELKNQVELLKDKVYSVENNYVPAEFAYNAYRATAGEVEAFDTQARQNLTPEQRAATTPYSSQNVSPDDLFVLYQNAKGSITFASDAAQAAIKLFETADISTLPHETAHFLRRFVLDPSNPEAVKAAEARGISQEDTQAVADWAGAKDGKWDRGAEEKFARGWERFLRDFKAPTAELQPIFEKLAGWLKEVYQTIKGSKIDIEISPEVAAVFEKLALGTEVGRAALTTPSPDTATEATPAPAPQAQQENTTSLKNESTDRDLERMGFTPLAKQAAMSIPEEWNKAQAALEADPEAGIRLIDSINTKARQLEPEEQGIALAELTNRKLAQGRAQQNFDEAVKSGDTDKIAAARQSLDAATNNVYSAIVAIQKAGTSWGRAGRLRQIAINDDFSLAAMQYRYRNNVNEGKPLTQEQERQIAEISEKLRQAEAREAMYREANDALEAGDKEKSAKLQEQADLIEKLTNDIERAQKAAGRANSTVKSRVREKLKPQAEAALERLKSRGWLKDGSDTLFQTEDSPSVLQGIKDAAIILADWMAGTKIADKAFDLAEVSAKLVETFGEKITPYVERIFGQAKQVYNETAESVQGRNAPTSEEILNGINPEVELDRSDVGALARAEVIAGKRGQEVLDAVFEKLQPMFPDLTRDKVAEIFTEYGKVSYPSTKEIPKELARIRSIERALLKLKDVQEGRLPKRTGFQRGETDAESREIEKKFREEFRALEEKLRAAGVEIPSDEKKLKSALEAIKRRTRNEIEEIERALENKTPRTKPDRTPVATDEETNRLRARLEELRTQERETFGDRELTDAQRAERASKQLDRQIAEEEAMLTEGILRRPKGEKITSPEIEAKRQRLADLREQRRSLDPETTPLAQAKRDVKAAIERLTKKIAENDVSFRQKKPIDADAELTELIKTREALSDEIAEMRKAINGTTVNEQAVIRRALARSKTTLTKIQTKLNSGDLSIPPRRQTAASQDPKLIAVRNQIKALNKELASRRLTSKDPSVMETRLRRYLAQIEARKNEYQRRAAQRDFKEPNKAEPLRSDAALKAKADLDAAKRAFNKLLLEDKLSKRSFGKKALDTTLDAFWYLSRTLLASYDASGIGRQGGLVFYTHPRLAAQQIPKHFKWTEASADKAQAELERMPAYHRAKEAGLALTDRGEAVDLNRLEENYKSQIARHIPLVGKGVEASENGYVTYLNSLRMAYFSLMLDTLKAKGGDTDAAVKLLAKHANNMTGRGNLGRWDNNAALLADALFSPRFIASRLGVLGGMIGSAADAATLFRRGDPETKAARKLLALERARTSLGAAIFLGSIQMMLSAFGGDDEKDKGKKMQFGTDPTSSDFGKLKIGEKRYDFGTGLLQYITLASRLATGKSTNSNGLVTYHSGPLADPNKSNATVLGQFLRQKLSPTSATAVNLLSRKDSMGQPVYWEKEAIGSFIPLPVSDMYEGYRKLGLGAGTAGALMNFFGIGSNAYGPETDKEYKSSLEQDIITGFIAPTVKNIGGPELNPLRYQMDPSVPMNFNPKKPRE